MRASEAVKEGAGIRTQASHSGTSCQSSQVAETVDNAEEIRFWRLPVRSVKALKPSVDHSEWLGVAEAASDELQILDHKIKQLKFEYEQYFSGARPREPQMLRGEVQKIVGRYSNVPLQNTAQRFRFNSLCARYFAMRRHWDSVLRKIEEGTYERHIFKAKLRERARSEGREAGPAKCAQLGAGSPAGPDLFDSYLAARKECGESVSGVTRERLEKVIAQQGSAIRERYGCDEVRFRVVVESGKTKLKATPVKGVAARTSKH